uniref:Uncharacterized protein n=1 Tax=Oryza glumipatula TaxID=40148 RepID=A0A0E0A684_9ORYZ
MVRSGVDGDNDGENYRQHVRRWVQMGNSNSGPHSGRGASARWTRGGLHQLHLPHFHLPSPRSRHDGLQLLLLPLDNVNTQGQQQHLGFGTQLGMNAANGFAGGVGNTLARESIHHVTNYAVRSISSHHHRDGQPPEDYDGNAAGVAETIAYNHAETGGSWEHV